MFCQKDECGVVRRDRAEEQFVEAGVVGAAAHGEGGEERRGSVCVARGDADQGARRVRVAWRREAAALSRALALRWRRARPSVDSEARMATGSRSATTGPRRRARQTAASTAARASWRVPHSQPDGTRPMKLLSSSAPSPSVPLSLSPLLPAAEGSLSEGRYQTR